MKGGPGEKLKPVYQTNGTRDLTGGMGGNKHVKDKTGGAGKGKTHGQPSNKLTLHIKTK